MADDTLSGFPETMRAKQVAAVFRVPVRTVYNWLNDGTLPAVRVGRTICVPKAAVLQRFEDMRHSPKKPPGAAARPAPKVDEPDRDMFGPRR